MQDVRVFLPADDAAHRREPWEWWYWTGHLETLGGRWFGFELVFFRFFQGRWPGYLTHHALTDIQAGRFHHTSSTETRSRFPVTDGFDLVVGPFHAHGGNGHDVLHGEVDGWVMDLELCALKPPMLQHTVGFTDYRAGGYTWYYSRPRMQARGTLRKDDVELPVTGLSWFDHQWGQLAHVMNQGWDWFAIQLEDGRDIMIILLANGERRSFFSASISDKDGAVREIPESDCSVQSLGSWTSPHSGTVYPLGWRMVVQGLELNVTPVMQDQELRISTMIYWEGAAVVSGDALGRAYIELTCHNE